MSLDDLRNYIQMEITTKNESIKLNSINNSEKKKLLKNQSKKFSKKFNQSIKLSSKSNSKFEINNSG